MLSYEEQAIMRNLPAIVADLESMDIIDHLTATTPPSITPADYESIIVTSQREGRRAGVRCLIACLLRRTESSKIFQSLLSILKEDYSHLSDLLSNTYESLKKEKKNDELDFGAHSLTLLHFSPVVEVDESTTISTPCQLVSKDIENSKIPLKILGSSEYDIIFSIISTISSHPIAVINWRDLLNELLGCATVSVTTCGSSSSSNSGISRINNSESKNNNSSTTDFENFQWCASNCRRGLFHFFSINMIRNLESRGSPFKRSQLVISNTVKFNLQFIKKLIVEQLIPALQHLNLWNLTNRIQEEIEYNDENRYDSLRDISFNKCSLLYANDLPYRLLDSNYHTTNNGTNLSSDHSQSLSSFSFLKSFSQFNYAKSLLFSCVEPLFHHSLILLDWPFLLHQLNVCPVCISYLLMYRSPASQDLPIESFDCYSSSHNMSVVNQNEKIRNSALKIYFYTVLHNTLYQRMISDKKNNNNQMGNQSGDVFSESIQKSCVASVIHTQLLPALRSLNLKALHDEVEQLAFQMLH